jgi:hypothetical protein
MSESFAESANSPEPLKGLPPVKPPSGRHIVQLFLIPGLIVAGAVTVLLGFSWLASGSRSPEKILQNIESANADIRWRAASDLAQVLKRDDKLAADASFGLRLAEKLARGLEELDKTEAAERAVPVDEAHKRERAEAHKAFVAQRNYCQFLSACLGNLSVPVGAPVLCDLAKNGRGQDDKLRVHMRRQAVLALANLGESRKRFDKLPDEEKAKTRQQLESESQSLNSETRKWAETGLAGLDGKSVGVVDTLAECAKEPVDIFLRELVGLALGFWEGDAREQKVAENALVMLARDVGRGERITIEEGE